MDLSRMQLIGNRVKVLPMQPDHVESLFWAAENPEIWAYMPLRVETLDDMRSLVNQALVQRETGSELPFVIQDLATNRIVGSTRFLDISEVNLNLEIGWTWLAPSVWRTPVNTETKYLLLQYCFETLHLIRVQLKTDARNRRSQQAIERIGGVKEGILRKHRVMYDGYVRDSVYYSILDSEWPAVRERLQKMLSNEHYNVGGYKS